MASHAEMEKESKKERLEARLTPEQKKHIEHAARIKGTSVSDFVVLSADDAAVRTIREQEVLTLNEREREVFANALLNRRQAREVGADIYFGDEAGVRSDSHAGTTWGIKGQTPVVRSTGQRSSVNMISAVSARGHMR